MLKQQHTSLEKLSLQKIGSKLKEIPNIKAQGVLDLAIEEKEDLQNFFLSAFKGQPDVMKFHHHIELSYNPLYESSKKLFAQELDFLDYSHQVLNHLYAKSNHPHIKTGELFVVHFRDMQWQDIHTEAIGIFKVENKVNFLQFKEAEGEVHMRFQKGVKLQKIDKACLILNTQESDGFRVFSVDNNNYDAAYWQKAFLDVEWVETQALNTKNYVQFLNTFATQALPMDDPLEQKKMVSEGLQMMNENEFVNEKMIVEELLQPREISIEEYHSFKNQYEEGTQQKIATAFTIEPSVLRKEEKKLKREIILDEQIQIKLDLQDTDSLNDNIEKGYDAQKKMKYYKVYYIEERGK